MTIDRRNAREIKAPTGPELTCRSWQTEAPFRMLQNNLDRDVAENPDELVVYGGIGRAARSWASSVTIQPAPVRLCVRFVADRTLPSTSNQRKRIQISDEAPAMPPATAPSGLPSPPTMAAEV